MRIRTLERERSRACGRCSSVGDDLMVTRTVPTAYRGCSRAWIEANLQDNHIGQRCGVLLESRLQMRGKHGNVDEVLGAVERQEEQVEREGRHVACPDRGVVFDQGCHRTLGKVGASLGVDQR